MHALLYTSRLRRGLTRDDLDALVSGTQSYTADYGLTGLFLYGGSPRSLGFVEWIEGPKVTLREAFERIALDGRHEDAHILGMGAAKTLVHPHLLTPEGRLFSTWSALETHASMLPSTLEEFLHVASRRSGAAKGRRLSTA